MNIIITGVSRGIGLELAAQALRKGHHVLGVARVPEESKDLQALRSEFKDHLKLVTADVDDPAAPAKIASLVSWPCVDILINNAGVYKQGESREDFAQSFAINSVAPLMIARELYPLLKKSKQPKLIQITSLMGSIADNESGGSYAYRSSKAALNMITQSIAQDEEWLMTAVVHPGWVQTRMGGKGAPTSVVESATGIWRVIDGLKETGGFWDFEGDRLPW